MLESMAVIQLSGYWGCPSTTWRTNFRTWLAQWRSLYGQNWTLKEWEELLEQFGCLPSNKYHYVSTSVCLLIKNMLFTFGYIPIVIVCHLWLQINDKVNALACHPHLSLRLNKVLKGNLILIHKVVERMFNPLSYNSYRSARSPLLPFT